MGLVGEHDPLPLRERTGAFSDFRKRQFIGSWEVLCGPRNPVRSKSRAIVIGGRTGDSSPSFRTSPKIFHAVRNVMHEIIR
jgi:hypothetical protein